MIHAGFHEGWAEELGPVGGGEFFVEEGVRRDEDELDALVVGEHVGELVEALLERAVDGGLVEGGEDARGRHGLAAAAAAFGVDEEAEVLEQLGGRVEQVDAEGLRGRVDAQAAQ